MSAAVQLQLVDKIFPNGFAALRGVQLNLSKSKLTSFLGPSGCGKSTLLRLIAGLEKPSSGVVRIDGKDVTHMGPEYRPIGMVFQNYSLFPHLSVLDNVRYGLRQQKVSPPDCDQRARSAIEAVGLRANEGSRTTELSGGEQQRVALARALAMRPRVLLLDEPLSSVDVHQRRKIREDIRELQKKLGLTVLYVTHDHHEAMSLSDTIVLMRDGCVVQTGTPKELYQSPHSEFAASFMGDAVVFDAHIDREGSVHLGPLHLELGLNQRHGKVRLVVRPHGWRMLPASGSGLPGQILSRAYLGRSTEYRVQTSMGNLLVLVQGETYPRQISSPVSIQLSAEGVSVVLPQFQTKQDAAP